MRLQQSEFSPPLLTLKARTENYLLFASMDSKSEYSKQKLPTKGFFVETILKIFHK